VTVNGTSYDVAVEDLGGGGVAVTGVVPAAAPAAGPATYSGPGNIVKAPLTGDVLRFILSEGDAVKKGDEILILEAMKMETKVVSPYDGRIAKHLVQPGDKVENGDALVAVE
jgi:biotin carboxyl carrier protein